MHDLIILPPFKLTVDEIRHDIDLAKSMLASNLAENCELRIGLSNLGALDQTGDLLDYYNNREGIESIVTRLSGPEFYENVRQIVFISPVYLGGVENLWIFIQPDLAPKLIHIPIWILNRASHCLPLSIDVQDATVHLSTPRLEAEAIDFQDTHIFNKYAPDELNTSIFFPYQTAISRRSLHKPTNEFGHRINRSIEEFSTRGADEKVVAIFGGSAVFSPHCTYQETFSQQLQHLFDQHFEGSNVNIHVLNFGQPGVTVLSELQSYLLFCERLKPNIVIAHDGFNDLWHGMLTDSYLLNKFDMTYETPWENWAKILHDTAHVEGNRVEGDHIPINFPNPIISAYITRKKQFKRFVEAEGSRFIAGLQPYCYSKAELSKRENFYIDHFLQSMPWYSRMMEAMQSLYKLISKAGDQAFEGHLNFDSIFYTANSEKTHFSDHVHMTPTGDSAIAETYFTEVLNVLESI